MLARFFRSEDAARWDSLCANSYGATFLHTRRFLSYHGERFVDRSVVVESAGRWLGVLPAALEPDDPSTCTSHPGSSFGGIVHDGALRGGAMIEGLLRTAALLREAGLRRLRYKVVPTIYHRAPAQDDLYALFRLGARRYRCDLSSCIDLSNRLVVSARRRRSIKKAQGRGVVIGPGGDHLATLWEVLERNLRERHGVEPTHTDQELALIAARHPGSIEAIVAWLDGVIVAGVVLFKNAPVVHVQYIGATQAGQQAAALDALLEHCIARDWTSEWRYFDFGISTERHGEVLNEGLHDFKSEFGSSGVAYEFYELELEALA